MLRFAKIALALLALATPARADFTVAPNIYAGAEAPTVIFGPLQSGGITLQFVLPASQFGAIPVGSQITSIGFRLDAGAASINVPLTFAQYNIQIGRPASAFPTLSSTFADNLGPDTITARTGPLIIPAGSLIGGAGPNPFFNIAFATPYTYKGGDILVTLRHTGNGVFNLANDAAPFGPLGTSTISNDFAATAGGLNFNVPVVQFGFTTTAVPEPASFAMVGLGLAGVGLVARRRRA